ncbi:protein MEMO1 isoform X2 [Apodemus sylvaticus]|uniref:protein MEMO1 isoform X2 n=1 Tax=Apodemus sylvaticus TaxID=10129 RepID=UPI0022438087|nr:protein MEMO1 isoform X2 [Apodemus sylvaticus]
MQDTRTVGLVLPMLTNKWIHLLPGEFSSSGLPIMCPCLGVRSPVWTYIGLLCMTCLLTRRFTESYGRQECLNACLCRQMKMNTVLKCICLIQLKPWKVFSELLPHHVKIPNITSRRNHHKDEFTIIPVLVGALSESKEQEFGKLFSKYLADPSNLFVVSSDFCHWGQRFRYSYYDESQGEIYRSIEHLDKMGMSIIEQLDPVSFSNYLKKYHNTICGRHPIGVLLNAITELQKSGVNMSFSFLNYAQSSQCRSWQDSSVSYAAGALTVH